MLEQTLPVAELVSPKAAGWPAIDPTRQYADVRRDVLAVFEQRYIDALLEHHQGNVSVAARAAGIDRGYVYRLRRRGQP